MIELNSSLRSVSPEVTLVRARAMADDLGISRVTNITRLDTVGIPVFSSVRPTAVRGSLCVNAGKGVRPIEAQVGAYMEAIEYAFAEPGASAVDVIDATARDVLDGHARYDAILDFCPIVNRAFDPAAPLACVMAHDLVSDRPTLVPAELVLLPYVGSPGTGNFGSSSNGLSSGNTVAEATLHGLLEVIERDVRSFNNVRDTSVRIDTSTLPEHGQRLVRTIEAAGLELCVRSLPNDFAIPLFEAILWDPFAQAASYMNGGYGCHLMRGIALVRAITEAVQSRLSWIHGGRDDLDHGTDQGTVASPADQARDQAARFAILRNWPHVIRYDEVDDGHSDVRSIDEALQQTLEALIANGIRHVCRLVFTDPGSLLHVVRIVVPRLELFSPDSHRVGPRLRDFIRRRA